MRRFAFACLGLLALLGCPNPDDGFVLSGTVVDQDGRPVRNHEVRVLRDLSVDGERCGPWEPFTTLTTDEAGRYSTTVYRYQQTLGQPVPRYFRVESSSLFDRVWVTAFHFRFAPVDVALPELFAFSRRPSGASLAPGLTDRFTEARIDGAMAWRGNQEIPVEERSLSVIEVDRLTRDEFLQANLLGLDAQWLSLEARLERPFFTKEGQAPSRVRGRPCDAGSARGPCPWTDGRMLPERLPAGTRSVAITLSEGFFVSQVSVHGLQVSGTPDRVVLEAGLSTEEGLEWRPWTWVSRGKEIIEWSRTHCSDRGAFLVTSARPTPMNGLRLRVLDSAGEALELTSLAEVSLP
jgi:hypothetical protein